MDEPTIGLDMIAKEEFISYIKKIKMESKTILISTHDPYTIEKLCDIIIIIDQGSISYIGNMDSFIDKMVSKNNIKAKITLSQAYSMFFRKGDMVNET